MHYLSPGARVGKKTARFDGTVLKCNNSTSTKVRVRWDNRTNTYEKRGDLYWVYSSGSLGKPEDEEDL